MTLPVLRGRRGREVTLVPDLLGTGHTLSRDVPGDFVVYLPMAVDHRD